MLFYSSFSCHNVISLFLALYLFSASGLLVTAEVALLPVHYGTKPGHFETSKIHFPTSEGVSKESERANE